MAGPAANPSSSRGEGQYRRGAVDVNPKCSDRSTYDLTAALHPIGAHPVLDGAQGMIQRHWKKILSPVLIGPWSRVPES